MRFLEISKATIACTGTSSSQGFHLLLSILRASGSPGADHLERYKHIPFPVKLISQTSIVWLARFDTKWAEEERHPVIPRNVLVLLRYFLVVNLKNLKQIKLY